MAIAAGMQKKIWNIRPAAPGAAQLAKALGISPVLAQVLINRGVAADAVARGYLTPKLTDLIEPARMPGIADAVARIKRALADGERIAIYGDYDVDGITSVAILWHLLTMLGGAIEYYIPHRIDEGYGLNEDAVVQLAESGVRLIITVDCGITAVAQAQRAADLGVDLIITDHHLPGETLPQAAAIVHPRLEDYPNPDSAGAMVAFKLAWALADAFKTSARVSGPLREFLINATTLAAMGTIADVADLRGENRILTSYGLKALTESKLHGIVALIETAELLGRDLDSYHIAFRLAPMLNAAGRMGHARLAVELLTAENPLRCTQIAQYLKEQNRLRQQHQRKIFTQAREIILASGLNHPDRKTIVLADENWHSGIIGIVASRIIDEYFRPTIMINTANGVAQGSARSVAGFNIVHAIAACSEHLISFGGHAMAAGLKIETHRIGDFARAFEAYAQEHLDPENLVDALDIDAACTIADLSQAAVRELALLEPTGQGNPRPLFA
ncbi:MAG: single-stranded-DNA-specific exonuclease RecJ, partial [Phycisphaerae bacterium]|nr:single-stranded-DNA-specific exonuclease RecJ [Phycisphaerae bacterium]